jgi:hypothetical protein
MTYWLPARNVSLQGSWHPSQTQVHVGDPITLDLDLKALGLTAAQLPDLSAQLSLPPGLKAYPDQPKLKDTPQGDELLGERDQSIALIADQPGQFQLPEVRLSWWDTQANQAREVVLPGRTLSVQPAAGSALPAPGPAQTQQTPAASGNHSTESGQPATSGTPGAPGSLTAGGWLTGARSPWPWITLAFAVLWLITLIAWLRSRAHGGGPRAPTSSRKTQPESPSAANARSAFHKACQTHDAPAARRHLLTWVNAARPIPRTPGLNALASRIRDPQLTQLLRELDRACYAGGSWNGEALAAALRELPEDERLPLAKDRELAPLYR